MGVNRSPSGDIFSLGVCGYTDVELEDRAVAEESIWGWRLAIQPWEHGCGLPGRIQREKR